VNLKKRTPFLTPLLSIYSTILDIYQMQQDNCLIHLYNITWVDFYGDPFVLH